MQNDRPGSGLETFLDTHLNQVSRSFAFCIARLEAPLRRQVGLSYLICRILDSIEDSDWGTDGLSAERQKSSFMEFVSFLKVQPNDAQVSDWSLRLITQAAMPEAERNLARDAGEVFRMFWNEHSTVRTVISEPVESMAKGMMEFRGVKLLSLSDVNRYCFFVAGVVGEILTGLLKLIAEDRGVKVVASLAEGFRFGLFLQKVNLLKDREKDLQEGRDLVPSRRLVMRSAFEDARLAFSYLKSIPIIFESYRLFCGWSLFLGLASLPHIAKNKKIGRLETIALLAVVERHVRSNAELDSLFAKYLEKAQKACPGEEASFEASGGAIAARESDAQKTDELKKYRKSYVGRAADQDLETLLAAADGNS